MLIAEDIHKYYGDMEVLKGVNLHVKKGEIVAIVGDSGAGKSTLLHILGTLDRPDSGKLLLNGKPFEALMKNNLADFRNEHIGFIFQSHNLLPEFSALENVCLPGFIRGTKERIVRERAKKLLTLLKLDHRFDHKPSALSGGEQQRVSVARSLINQPDIIFADEPSGNLDSKNADDLHQLFFDLRDQIEQTFVIVTHNNDLAKLTDRKLTMKDGLLI